MYSFIRAGHNGRGIHRLSVIFRRPCALPPAFGRPSWLGGGQHRGAQAEVPACARKLSKQPILDGKRWQHLCRKIILQGPTHGI